ncbi:MAG: DUF1801 domain-containing protein [Thermomicrobiales bacterium]
MARIATIDEYIESLAAPLRKITTQLLALMDKEFPKTTGKVWHGHPVWMGGKNPVWMGGKNPVAGFKDHTSYVTYMIWRGQEHSEAAVPRGMASRKISSVADIEDVQAADWLRESGEA